MIQDTDVYTIGHSTRSLEALPAARSSQRVRSDPFALPLLLTSRASDGLKSLGLVTASDIRVGKASGSPDSLLQPPARNALLQESRFRCDQHGRLLKALTGGYTIQAGGPVAQGQSDRLITGWLEVRILPGPPFLLRHVTGGASRRLPPEQAPAGH
jgi:hypothetical protein